MEIMGTPANRKFVETLLHEISNKDLAMKLSIDEKVPAKPASSTSARRAGYRGQASPARSIQETIR